MLVTIAAVLVLAAPGGAPEAETDAENRARCAQAGAGMRKKIDRFWAQERCRQEYLRSVEARAEARQAEERAGRAAQRQAELEEAAETAAKNREALRLRPEQAAARAEAAAKAKAEAEARRQEEDAAARARWEAEQAVAARRGAEIEAELVAEGERAAQSEAATRAACGRDYQRVKVGMAWERVRKCSGPFRAVGQVETRRGVLSTFEAPGGLVQVLNGKVSAWVSR